MQRGTLGFRQFSVRARGVAWKEWDQKSAVSPLIEGVPPLLLPQIIGHRGTVPPFDLGILTLALWALHGKNGTKSRQCPHFINPRPSGGLGQLRPSEGGGICYHPPLTQKLRGLERRGKKQLIALNTYV